MTNRYQLVLTSIDTDTGTTSKRTGIRYRSPKGERDTDTSSVSLAGGTQDPSRYRYQFAGVSP